MGKGSNTNTVTKDAEPWEGQAPYLRDLYSQAQNQFQQGPGQFYPNRLTALPSDTTLQAEQILEQTALGQQSALTDNITPAFQGSLMSPYQAFTDPLLQQSLAAGLRPIEESTSRLLQQARRDATSAGQLGGSRQGILESEVLKDMLTKQSDVASKLYGDVYGDLTKSRTAALGLSPTIMSSYTTPAQTLAAVGASEQARSQADINEQIARFNFQQQAPGQNLNQYGNIVAGSILPPSVTSSSTGGGVSDLAATTGGAATGAALGSMFAYPGASGTGFMSTLGPWGAAAGALYGLLSN
jgi:hypothetical protein